MNARYKFKILRKTSELWYINAELWLKIQNSEFTSYNYDFFNRITRISFNWEIRRHNYYLFIYLSI